MFAFKRLGLLVVFSVVIFMALRLAAWAWLPGLTHLPEDPCYFETRETPWWVERFFIDYSGHIEPAGNLAVVALIMIAAVVASLFLSMRLVKVPAAR